MNNQDLIEAVNEMRSKNNECIDLLKQVKVLDEKARKLKEWFNDPNVVELNNILEKTASELENSAKDSLPQEAIVYIDGQQKYSHQLREAYSALVETQDKMITQQSQVIDSELYVINQMSDFLTGQLGDILTK